MAALVAAFLACSRARVRQAISSLLSTAKRALPQRQRQQLAKAEKQAAVAASRAARKEAAGAQAAAAAVWLLRATHSCSLLPVHYAPHTSSCPVRIAAHLSVDPAARNGPTHAEDILLWLLVVCSFSKRAYTVAVASVCNIVVCGHAPCRRGVVIVSSSR
jgi:hypothetical protein